MSRYLHVIYYPSKICEVWNAAIFISKVHFWYALFNQDFPRKPNFPRRGDLDDDDDGEDDDDDLEVKHCIIIVL